VPARRAGTERPRRDPGGGPVPGRRDGARAAARMPGQTFGEGAAGASSRRPSSGTGGVPQAGHRASGAKA